MFSFIISFLAGMGAGLGTGLAGLSAAAVISPILIVFLDVPAYQAIGIGLASDVLASAASAFTYGKNKNIDIRNGLVMMAAVLTFTVLGSYLSSFVPEAAIGSLSVFTTFLVGLKFIFRPVSTTKKAQAEVDPRKRMLQSVLFGSSIGLIAGFVGAGGGMMMLLVFTSILGYELKTAVGTSVFIMTFTALTGGISHFLIDGMPDLTILLYTALSTLLWARVGASVANTASTKKLNRMTGFVLTTVGAIIIIVNYS